MKRLALAATAAVVCLSSCGGPSSEAVSARVAQACRPIPDALGTGYMPEATPKGVDNLRAASSTAGDALRTYAAENLSGDAKGNVDKLAAGLLVAGAAETPSDVTGALEQVSVTAKRLRFDCNTKFYREHGETIEKHFAKIDAANGIK